ncbi:hypothetical protein PPL_09697 [Heterostelium album PN500]|uniref:FAD-binding domain-containing protein n=1 Tax=Heterostelium pallidum (strain ATCC 26659 / Pp 5 / PN500) TaxID=670386 RepID=D3BNJ4_HETP5|nr:hypothetical protein PPL_09697 [Heterostelium album PN500]EFA76945.1 hypothetical protein PPL_09697 [Heterostelium album PN500]|eukprot:XP_020429077.1 hypothetical protein PPL_09697 [Heterostelium album PN500]
MSNSQYSDHLIKDKKIGIVGGGPAGIVLTRLLQQRGANVKLYERDIDRTARVQGGSLDIHDDSGQLAIKDAGVYDEFLKKIRPGGGHHSVVDKYAVVQFLMPDLKCFNSRPEIDRGDLREIFIDSLEPDTVMWNHHLQDVIMNEDNSGILLKFKGGKEEVVDFLVGADGYASKIRPFVTNVEPIYSGILFIQTEIDNPKEVCPTVYSWVNGGNMFGLSDGKFVAAQQKTSGSMVVYFSSRKDENFAKESNLLGNDRELVRQYLLKEYSDWDPVFLDLIKEATKAPVTVRNLSDTARFNNINNWRVNSRVTLVGDCAHVMPPFAGDGANMAMMDSLELARELTSLSNKTMEEAIENYQTKMLKRTKESGNDTNKSLDDLHSPRALESFVSMILPGPFKVYDLYVYYFKSSKQQTKEKEN